MLKQSLSQKQLQKMSPLQIQFMKLLQLNTADFIERVEQELLDNPAIEKKSDGDDDYDNSIDKDNSSEDSWESEISEYLNDDNDYSSFKMSDDYSDDDNNKEIPIPTHQSFFEYLTEQARNNIKDEKQLDFAMHLIGSLEDDGYLRRDLKAIVNDLAFTENISTTTNELEEVLKEIQKFDPAGLGARDLKECLEIQLKRKIRKDSDNKSLKLAIKILEEQLEAFTKKHYKKIIRSMKVSEEELRNAISEITKLNPKPGQVSSSNNYKEQYVIPDFTVNNINDELIISLNSRNAPELNISRAYKNTLREYEANKEKKSLKDSAQYVKQKIDGAKWFIDSIRQRQNTLLSTMRAIVESQESFFFDGDEKLLKPMVMKDIAEKINMDISTVSRVANSKYVETPFGIYPLKFFFSEGLENKDGEEVSNREIKSILKDTVDKENKSQPYTDAELMKILKQKGYNIARRTVAKYREQLNIPVSRMRKQL